MQAQVLGGIDKESDPCNAYLGNIMSAAHPLTINRAVSLQDFNAGRNYSLRVLTCKKLIQHVPQLVKGATASRT